VAFVNAGESACPRCSPIGTRWLACAAVAALPPLLLLHVHLQVTVRALLPTGGGAILIVLLIVVVRGHFDHLNNLIGVVRSCGACGTSSGKLAFALGNCPPQAAPANLARPAGSAALLAACTCPRGTRAACACAFPCRARAAATASTGTSSALATEAGGDLVSAASGALGHEGVGVEGP
jgi:hypothetical protein